MLPQLLGGKKSSDYIKRGDRCRENELLVDESDGTNPESSCVRGRMLRCDTMSCTETKAAIVFSVCKAPCHFHGSSGDGTSKGKN